MIRIVLYSLIALLFIEPFTGSSVNAASTTLTVSATVLSKNRCRFRSANTTLSFGTLDPLNPVDVNTSATIDFRCQGADPIATYLITNNDGLYASGPGIPRMQNTLDAAQYIEYNLVLNPTTGTAPKGIDQTLIITGDILGSGYQFASIGNYTDTIVLSIMP